MQVLERKAKALQKLGENCEDVVAQLNQLIQKVTFNIKLCVSCSSQGLVPEEKQKALKETLLNLKKIISVPKPEEKQETTKSAPSVLGDSVRVSETAEQGRHLVATRDIAVGEQVVSAADASNLTFKHQLLGGKGGCSSCCAASIFEVKPLCHLPRSTSSNALPRTLPQLSCCLLWDGV